MSLLLCNHQGFSSASTVLHCTMTAFTVLLRDPTVSQRLCKCYFTRLLYHQGYHNAITISDYTIRGTSVLLRYLYGSSGIPYSCDTTQLYHLGNYSDVTLWHYTLWIVAVLLCYVCITFLYSHDMKMLLQHLIISELSNCCSLQYCTFSAMTVLLRYPTIAAGLPYCCYNTPRYHHADTDLLHHPFISHCFCNMVINPFCCYITLLYHFCSYINATPP